MSEDNKADNKPVMRIRSGAVSASIFRKVGNNGQWFTVDVQRCYKGSDDQLHYTNSFGRDESLVAAKVLDMAHTWIVREEAKASKASPGKTEGAE